MPIKREVKQFIRKTKSQEIRALFCVKLLPKGRIEFTCVPSKLLSPEQVGRMRPLLKGIVSILEEVVKKDE